MNITRKCAKYKQHIRFLFCNCLWQTEEFSFKNYKENKTKHLMNAFMRGARIYRLSCFLAIGE